MLSHAVAAPAAQNVWSPSEGSRGTLGGGAWGPPLGFKAPKIEETSTQGVQTWPPEGGGGAADYQTLKQIPGRHTQADNICCCREDLKRKRKMWGFAVGRQSPKAKAVLASKSTPHVCSQPLCWPHFDLTWLCNSALVFERECKLLVGSMCIERIYSSRKHRFHS